MKKIFTLITMMLLTFVAEANAEDSYIVAGVPTIFGTNWSPTDENNLMTSVGGGTYELTKSNVALQPDTYEYKVVKNGTTWMPGNNMTIQITEAGIYDITITFETATEKITSTIKKIKDIEAKTTYTIAGAYPYDEVAKENPPLPFLGVAWDATVEANDMETNDGGLTYTKTYKNAELEANTICYQVVKNRSNWIGAPGGGNLTKEVATAGIYNVTFTFTVATNECTCDLTVVTGISNINAVETSDNSQVYNLAGQRVDANSYKGVLIKNGKKFIAK